MLQRRPVAVPAATPTFDWPPEIERLVHAYRLAHANKVRQKSATLIQAAARTLLDTRIPFVLECFDGMGATPADLLEERRRLYSDELYYDEWCLRLHDWCPNAPLRRELVLAH